MDGIVIFNCYRVSCKIKGAIKSGYTRQDLEFILKKRSPTDLENKLDTTLNDVIKFTKNCTHLIIDSSYTKEEIKSRKGWGHLSLDDIEKIASRLPHVQIYLYHHDVFKTDFQIEMDSFKLLSEYNNVKLAKQLDVVGLS